ncbi:MAG: glutamine amidotransferase [Marinobacter sp.]|nr:glutamine amidotransferase [Marinobacter sp.]
MARVVILKTGSTYPSIRASLGDFQDWFKRALPEGLGVEVVNVAAGESPGQPQDWAGVIVTGSPAMVTERADWSEATAAWLAQAVAQSIPVLGVCYGHQLLAHALGGQVDYHPAGRESGTWEVQLLPAADQDALFGGMPSSFPVHLTHRQSVLQLPEGAVRLAANTFEPHQAFRVGSCAWGVQFHPEFTAEIMRAYLDVQRPDLEKEGQDASQLLAAVTDAPAATALLARFGRLVLEGLKT